MAKLSIKIAVIHECGTESMYNKIHDGQVLFFFLKEGLGWELCHSCSASSYSCQRLPSAKAGGAPFPLPSGASVPDYS